MGAPLAEDDVSRDDELGGRFFGAETFAGAGGGFVGAALGGVGGGAGVEEGEGGAWMWMWWLCWAEGEEEREWVGVEALQSGGRHSGKVLECGRVGGV